MTAAGGPIFVVGCPRSGTSALSWAVAAAPGCWTSAETHFFYYLLREATPSVAQAFAAADAEGSWLNKHGVALDEFLRHIGTGLDGLMQSRSGGLRWIDGSPENGLVGAELLRMFPTAQLLWVVRNPHAVCRSMLVSGFPMPWATDIDEAVATWSHYARAGLALLAADADRVLQVRQEDMQGDPDGVAAAIGRRLALEDPRPVAEFLATRRVNSSFDKSGYAPGSPHRDAGTLTLSAADFEAAHGDTVRAATGGLLSRLGY